MYFLICVICFTIEIFIDLVIIENDRLREVVCIFLLVLFATYNRKYWFIRWLDNLICPHDIFSLQNLMTANWRNNVHY